MTKKEALHRYNLCLDAISHRMEDLSAKCPPQGAVVGELDKGANKVKLYLFPSMAKARFFHQNSIPDEFRPAAPVVPIKPAFALML